MGIGFFASSILLGLAIGFVLQRGRFCMNTAFRDTIFIQDYTLFRGFIIALAVMIVGVNLLGEFKLIRFIPIQPFYPIANIVGGYVFGLGIVMVGGCGSGVWYKVGEGQFNSLIAVIGFFLGIHMTATGVFRPIYDLLKSVKVPIAGNSTPTLYNIIGSGPTVKWAVIAVVVIALLAYVMKGKPFSAPKQKGLEWPKVGVLLGLLGVAAFWAGDVWEGFPRGLSFTTPTGEFFGTLLTGKAMLGENVKYLPHVLKDADPDVARKVMGISGGAVTQHPLANIFPMYKLGPFKVTWASFFIIAVPFGAYISAKILGEFKWKVPPIDELISVIFGSLMMGFGATVAGGCNIGQGLTGASTLSIGSLVAILFIILGNWTNVYFRFIKPMQDI